MPKDLAHNLLPSKGIESADHSATIEGDVVDMKGHEGLMFVIDVGDDTALSSGNQFDFTVEEGDESDLSDGVEISSSNYQVSHNVSDDSAWDKALDDAAEANKLYIIGVKKSQKRYYRLVATETGTGQVIMSAVAIKGESSRLPHND